MVEILEADENGVTLRRPNARIFVFGGPDTERPIIVDTIQRLSHDEKLTAEHAQRLAGTTGPDSEVLKEAWAAIRKAQMSSTKEALMAAEQGSWEAIRKAKRSSAEASTENSDEPSIIAAARLTLDIPKA